MYIIPYKERLFNTFCGKCVDRYDLYYRSRLLRTPQQPALSPLPQKLNNTKLVYPPPAAYLETLYLPCFKITEHRVFANL